MACWPSPFHWFGPQFKKVAGLCCKLSPRKRAPDFESAFCRFEMWTIPSPPVFLRHEKPLVISTRESQTPQRVKCEAYQGLHSGVSLSLPLPHSLSHSSMGVTISWPSEVRRSLRMQHYRRLVFTRFYCSTQNTPEREAGCSKNFPLTGATLGELLHRLRVLLHRAAQIERPEVVLAHVEVDHRQVVVVHHRQTLSRLGGGFGGRLGSSVEHFNRLAVVATHIFKLTFQV